MTTPDIEFDYEFLEEGLKDIDPPEVISEISTEFAAEDKETPRAAHYRKKVSRGFAHIWKPLLQNPKTVDDAATILLYGPDAAKAVGKLADQDARARKIIDFATDGVDNPYVSVAFALIPMVLQLLRNHEDSLGVTAREIKIPIIKRSIRIKFGIKLGRFRNITTEPSYLTNYVLSDEKLLAVLNKQGIKVAFKNGGDATSNGAGTRSRFRRASAQG
jgi:hypothetical protein